MGLLDNVLGYFRDDDDDLEKTVPPPLQQQSRFGGLGLTPDQAGADFNAAKTNYLSLAGPVYTNPYTGTDYTTTPDKDQRTDREVITDTAVAAKDAVVEYSKDPKLPSAQQVKDFGVGMVTETVDLFDRLAKGEASLLEVFELASGVGVGAKVAQKAFPDPELDSSSFTTGMFLNKSAPGADMKALQAAQDAEAAGANREAIYKQTGWLRFSDEWVYEISDADSNIAMLQAYKKPFEVIESISVDGKIDKPTETGLRTKAQLAISDIFSQNAVGKITLEEAVALGEEIAQKLEADLTASAGTITKQVIVDPQRKLKNKGILSDVLLNDPLFEQMDDAFKQNSAQVGGTYNGYFGVQYGGKPPRGKSKVNAFPSSIRSSIDSAVTNEKFRLKQKADGSVIDPFFGEEALIKTTGGLTVNRADEQLLSQLKSGLINREQFIADWTWGVLLHETQHLVQNSLGMKSGRGAMVSTATDAARPKASAAIKTAMKDLSLQDGWKITKDLSKKYTGKGDQQNTGAIFASLNSYHNRLEKINSQTYGSDRDKNNALVGGVNKLTSLLTSSVVKKDGSAMSASEAADLTKDLLAESKVYDSYQTFRDIVNSRASKLSNPAERNIGDPNFSSLTKKEKAKKGLRPYEFYSRVAGEALARLVESRRNMTPDQLRENFPLNAIGKGGDLDVPENELFRVGGAYDPMEIDTKPKPPSDPVNLPLTNTSIEPDPQTILSVKDKNYFATDNLNDADLRLKDPVGYVAGDILRFIEFFPNGATLKAIQKELIEGSTDPGSKEFFNKTQKKANKAFYTDERLQEALVYIDNNGLASTIPNSADLIDTQIMPTWQRKKPDGTVLTREDLGYPPWPPEAPDAGLIDDQMEAGAMGSSPSDGGNNFPPKGPAFTSKTFDALGFSDEVIAEMAETNKRIKSNMATDAGRAAEQKRIDEKRDRLIEQYITAFTNTLASKGDKVVDLKALKYAMKKDEALGGIEAASLQAADTNVILERMGGDIAEQMMKDDRLASMLESPLFVGPKSQAEYGSEYTRADLDKADTPSHREYIRRNVEKDYSLTVDQEELITRVFDEGYDENLLEWASREHAIRTTLKKMKISTSDDQMDSGALGGTSIVPFSASAGPKTLDVYYDSRYDMIDSRGASAEDFYTDPVEYYGNRPDNIEGKLFKRTLTFNKPLEATSIRQAAVKLGIEKASPKQWEIAVAAKEQGFDGIILSDKKGNIKNIRELDNDSTDLSRELKDTGSVTKPIFTNSDRFWVRNFREDYFHLMPQASEVNAKKYHKDLIEKGISEQNADLAAADAFNSDMRTLAYYLAKQFPEHVDEIQVNPVAFINSVDSRMIEPAISEIEPMFRPSQKPPEGDN